MRQFDLQTEGDEWKEGEEGGGWRRGGMIDRVEEERGMKVK